MLQLIKVGESSDTARVHVIFVHGLGGHPYRTWQRGDDPDMFWPAWLVRDVAGAHVWTLSYQAPAVNWLGRSMGLHDRGVSTRNLLINTAELEQGKIVFVCHSLGGLVVKTVLRGAAEREGSDPVLRRMLKQVRGVVFYSTPHGGSSYATLADRLRLLTNLSPSTRDMMRNDANLRDLNLWYRGWVDKTDIAHVVFCVLTASLREYQSVVV